MSSSHPFDAVLLISFGGPQGQQEIRPFLQNVLRGRRVPPERIEQVAHHYELFGGVSPLTMLTERQASALRRRLEARSLAMPVYVGMRNWHPFLTDTLRVMQEDGVRYAVGVIAAAHHSYSSCTQYRHNVLQARSTLTHEHAPNETRRASSAAGSSAAGASVAASAAASGASSGPSSAAASAAAAPTAATSAGAASAAAAAAAAAAASARRVAAPAAGDTTPADAADIPRRGSGSMGGSIGGIGNSPGASRHNHDADHDAPRRGDEVTAVPEVIYAGNWHTHAGFIEATADRIAVARAALPPELRAGARIVFTAHSIPTEMAHADAYQRELRESATAVAARLGTDDWALVYQSRSGRPQDPWLEPDVNDYLRLARVQGVRAVILSPLGFVCDHIEVLYDLDIEAKVTCEEMGLAMARAVAVNDHPRFIDALTDAVAATIARYRGGRPLTLVDADAPNAQELPPPVTR